MFGQLITKSLATHYKEITMKKIFVIFLVTIVIVVACKREITEPNSSDENSQKTVVIAEGTVSYFEGGGTVEIQYPPGFVLINCHWITSFADSTHWPYLSGIDSSYLNTNVRVFGVAETDNVYGMFNMRGWYTKIIVDSLIVLN